MPFWVLMIIPIIYIISNWKNIPETVPLHYNIYGEVDKTGDKMNLIYLSTFIPFGTYIVFLLAKYIDPKKKIASMGNRYYTIRFLLSTILAATIFTLTYSIVNKTGFFGNTLFILIGIIFIFLGNYFKSIKPNYFIGFRTPWTLENDDVWRMTHHHCSTVWFIGGLILVFVNATNYFNPVWLINIITIVSLIIIPVVYSYFLYRNVTPKSN